jgi:hypothetical protein
MALFALELSDALTSRSLEVSYASALSMVNASNDGTGMGGGGFAPQAGGSVAGSLPSHNSVHGSSVARGGSMVSWPIQTFFAAVAACLGGKFVCMCMHACMHVCPWNYMFLSSLTAACSLHAHPCAPMHA